MAEASELVRDSDWQRLDPRMLLVYPLRDLLRFLPVLVGLVIAGSASGGMDVRWQLLGIGIPVATGLLRYATTSFRITEGRVELKRGLVDRHLLSTRVERVRTVELTASPFHRVLGLTTVRIGTGTASTKDEDAIDLDGLPVPRARALRSALLRASSAPVGVEEQHEAAAAPPPVRVVLRLDPRWARFAPLTSAGVVLAAGVVGLGSQILDGLGAWDQLHVDAALDEPSRAWLLGVPLLLVAVALVVSALAVAGYLMTNWDFTLTHSAVDHSWHLRRGLTTTRETSLDDERVSGVSIGEPLGLRLAGGGRLSAIVTGLDRKQQGSSVLVPPAPREVVEGVAGEVLGTHGPVTAPLRTHGPRARTRRWTRALMTPLAVAVALAAGSAFGGWSPWVLAPAALLLAGAAALAADRVRSLGHGLVERHFVVRSGSLYRQREALETSAVIGWNLRSTWFQRRAGLTMLVATTAGGSQAVTAIDVPEGDAIEVATAAVPGLVEQFLTSSPPGGWNAATGVAPT
jgi:putative membrane protein